MFKHCSKSGNTCRKVGLGKFESIRTKVVLICGVLGLLVTLTETSKASLIVTAIESGSDVVFSWGGDGSVLDLTGLPAPNFTGVITTGSGNPNPVGGSSLVGGSGNFSQIKLPSPNADYGTVNQTFTGATTGDPFGWSLGVIFVPAGFTSGSVVTAGSVTAAGRSFASLGISPGIIVINDWDTLGGDSRIILNVGAVPEPTTVFVLGVLFLMMILVSWHNRQKAPQKNIKPTSLEHLGK